MDNKCFIGLGVMGSQIAKHIAKSGFNIRVFNRTQEKAKAWVEMYGGSFFNSPKEAARESDMVFLCVGNDEDVRSVITRNDGVLQSLTKGSIIIDHTTTSADLSLEMSQICLSKGIDFIDAPVSGGQVGAEKGELTVMAGGRNKAFKSAKEFMDLYSKSCVRMGKSGSGQLTKMVNQICLAGLIQSLAEGINFSKKAGLNTKEVIRVISQGAAQSWQMDNRWKTMLNDEYNHGFAVDFMRKDLGIAISEAKKKKITLEVVEMVDGFYKDIQSMEGNRWDTSSLLRRLEDL